MNEVNTVLSVNVYQRLGPKTFLLSLSERLSVAMGFLFLAVVCIIAARLSVVPVEVKPFILMGEILFFGLFIVTGAIGFVVGYLVYKNHLFCVADDAFKIKSGIFTKIETAFPYRQIQNVEIERPFLFQILGLSKILIVTAGTDNPKTIRNEAEGVLPIVEREIATALQEELLRRSDVQRTKTTR